MRGLLIREPWISLILDRTKTWEIRSRSTAVRETIGLIRSGSGLIVGTARLVDVCGPLSFKELRRHRDHHQVPDDVLADFVSKYRGRAYAWVLAEAVPYERPIPYQHPSGAVIWVNLDGRTHASLGKRRGRE